MLRKFSRHLFDRRAYLYLLEQLLLIRQFSSNKPQLFILGLPRSGTTLVYQYLVHRLNVAYFTNGVGNYHLSPCIVTFFQLKRHDKYQSDFKSHYGKVNSAVSPREAGGVWGRFFGLDDYVCFEDVDAKKIRTLKNTVTCIQHLFGDLPFVNKNVKHMLRIDAISKIFPNAYFLVIERDLTEVGLSVIRGRYQLLQDPKQWWSVKPLNYADLKSLPIAEQIAYQLASLNKKMQEDFSKIAEGKVLKIHYSNFCNDPESLINTLLPVLGAVSFKNPAIPSFTQSKKEPETAEEERLIGLIGNAITI